MGADFSGFATKAGLKCADGLVIMPGAFAHQDKTKVPLVYQHVHTDPENVIGHVMLEARGDGMYAHAYFNSSPKGKHSKEMVQHEDVDALSIYANRIVKDGNNVIHGMIREVSLVLAGANPGARIDHVSLAHGDWDEETDDLIIFTGERITHAEGDDEDDEDGDETVEDVYNSMTEKQKTVVHYLVGRSLDTDTEEDGEAVEQGDTSDTDPATEDSSPMGSIFDKTDGQGEPTATLTHDDMKAIIATAANGEISLKKAVEDYALAHGIIDIEKLFPEATKLTNTPTWDKRRTEWVSSVLGAANKSPFSRIKTWTADITYEESRALGYVKGDFKKEEWFTFSSRTTTPQTVYKKQGIDRDDMIDITDFDVVAWKKGEMRLMLDEELARAILFGDGRAVDDPNKIREDRIRPILTDASYYTKQVGIDGDGSKADVILTVDSVIETRHLYKGSGQPTWFTSEEWLGMALTVRDNDGHRYFRTMADLAAEMRVSRIVPVELLNRVPGLVGILVDMNDYTVGADKGGQTTMFEDFDIDYNKYKYLLETRVSGALTVPSAAIAYFNAFNGGKTVVTPLNPSYDHETGVVTIPTVAGVKYYDQDNVVRTGTVTIPAGANIQLFAYPADDTTLLSAGAWAWSYLRVPA